MKKLIFLNLLLHSTFSFSQDSYFSVGYQIGQLGNGVNSFKNEVELLNRVKYPDLSNKLDYSNFVHGFELGYMYAKDEAKSLYLFWTWNNKHLIASGDGFDAKTNQNIDISLKYRHNYFNVIGFGFKFKKWFGIGYSPVDLGHLKVLYKNSGVENAHSYTHFYNVQRGLLSDYNLFGSSYYLDFFLKDRLRARLSYYRSYNGNSLRDQEDITTAHYYNANRFSFSLSYLFKIEGN